MANISIPLLFDPEELKKLLESNEDILALFPSEEEPINREAIQEMQELMEQQAPAAQGRPANTQANSLGQSISTGGRIETEVSHRQDQSIDIESQGQSINVVINTPFSVPQVVAPRFIVFNTVINNTEFTPTVTGDTISISRHSAKQNAMNLKYFDFDTVPLGIIPYGTKYDDITLSALNYRTTAQGLAVADSEGSDISGDLQVPWNKGNIKDESNGHIAFISRTIANSNAFETKNPAGIVYILFDESITAFGMDIFSLRNGMADDTRLTFFDENNNMADIVFNEFTNNSSTYYDSTVVFAKNSANRIAPIDLTDLSIGPVKLIAITVGGRLGFDNFAYGGYETQKLNTVTRGNLLDNDILSDTAELTKVILTAASVGDAVQYITDNPTLTTTQDGVNIEIAITAQTTLPLVSGASFTINTNGEYQHSFTNAINDSIQYVVQTEEGEKSAQVNFSIQGEQYYAVDDYFAVGSSDSISQNVFFNDFLSDSAIIFSVNSDILPSDASNQTFNGTSGGQLSININGDFSYQAVNTVSDYTETYTLSINHGGTLLSSDLSFNVVGSTSAFTVLESPAALTTVGQTGAVQLKSTSASTEYIIDMNSTVDKLFINNLIDYADNSLKFTNTQDINNDFVLDINDIISSISQTGDNGLVTCELTNNTTLYLQNIGTLGHYTPEEFSAHLNDLSIQVDIL